jgi:hypothetical protein
MSTYLDDIYVATDDLREAGLALAEIGRALNRVGMGALADEIGQIATCVNASRRLVHKAMTSNVCREAAVAEQSTKDIVNMVLAVSEHITK